MIVVIRVSEARKLKDSGYIDLTSMYGPLDYKGCLIQSGAKVMKKLLLNITLFLMAKCSKTILQ